MKLKEKMARDYAQEFYRKEGFKDQDVGWLAGFEAGKKMVIDRVKNEPEFEFLEFLDLMYLGEQEIDDMKEKLCFISS